MGEIDIAHAVALLEGFILEKGHGIHAAVGEAHIMLYESLPTQPGWDEFYGDPDAKCEYCDKRRCKC